MPRLSHILLVDGDASRRYDDTMLIRDYCDCEIDVASNGEEALVLVNKVWFDLILMDCSEPKVNGYDTTKKIKQLVNDKRIEPVPIVGLVDGIQHSSAKKSGGLFGKLRGKAADSEEQANNSGLDDVINAPLSKDHLRSNGIIKEILQPDAPEVESFVYSSVQNPNLTKDQEDAIRMLGLDYPFTHTQLKSRFRLLAKEYHPDAGGEFACEDKFHEINLAYEQLIKMVPD